MRAPISADDVKAAISKTGFPLENRLTEAFKHAKWGVLSNRYYVDDSDGRARELDLIAYKIMKAGELQVVTSVLVACKKDAEKTWAFLSRPRDRSDSNVDWGPTHIWTDVQPLNAFLSSDADWRQTYFNRDERAKRFAFDITKDVFAFREIAPPGERQKTRNPNAIPPPSKAAAAHNDSAIFNSVTGLLKALDSELSALPDRVPAKNRLYVFTLAVVVDAPMVDVSYTGEDCEVTEIEDLLMLARYMVRKNHFTSQVHFVRADKSAQFIEKLDRLAAVNAGHFKEMVPLSYASILSNQKVRAFFAPRVKLRLTWRLNDLLKKSLGHTDKIVELSLDTEGEKLLLGIDITAAGVSFLNASREAEELTSKVLREVCRYEGPFQFDMDIPF